MSEPESLNEVEPLVRHIARHNYDRLLMLSDGVFAIAITLLALELKVPEQWDGTLADLLRQSWRSIFAFLFGFGVVGLFWAAHRRMFAKLTAADVPLTVINLFLLCLVSLTPAVAELLATHGPAKGISYYFALFAAIGVTQLLLWSYAVFVGRLAHSDLTVHGARLELLRLSIPAIVGTGMTLALGLGVTMEDRWALPLLLFIVVPTALLRRRLHRRAAA
ncbi:TMEM175 family protein [Sphingomonas sp. KRR8]|uniref:TMEM175 family protein n=1 Tax=Sphingomonas sp. KRR8 TaxID=2942996 RepID=UPI002021AAC7|nr:TMEM175 family protein [Sphingomonas sp. KRR8]URD61019.1 TMEM175 family protein [Sphingomonas sp. KRR8]